MNPAHWCVVTLKPNLQPDIAQAGGLGALPSAGALDFKIYPESLSKFWEALKIAVHSVLQLVTICTEACIKSCCQR
jgi:hypothetical protein